MTAIVENDHLVLDEVPNLVDLAPELFRVVHDFEIHLRDTGGALGVHVGFVSRSDGSFWGVVLGLLQAIVWPVYLIFNGLELLGA